MHGLSRFVQSGRERSKILSDEDSVFDSDGTVYEKQSIMTRSTIYTGDESNAEEADIESLSDDVIEIPMDSPTRLQTDR